MACRLQFHKDSYSVCIANVCYQQFSIAIMIVADIVSDMQVLSAAEHQNSDSALFVYFIAQDVWVLNPQR